MNDSEWTKIWFDSGNQWAADVSVNGIPKDIVIVVDKSEDGFEAKTFFNGKEYSSTFRPSDSAAVLLLLNRIVADDLNNGIVQIDSLKRIFDWYDGPPTYEEAVEHNSNHSVWGPISNWMFWSPMDQTVFVDTIRLNVSDEKSFADSIKKAIDNGAVGWCAASIHGDKVRWPKLKKETK